MTDDATGRSCPWCSARAPADATTCGSCGAALAQRESIGDLVIPGVTSVDPALQAIDGQPMRIAGPSPTQGMASGVIVAASLGGPVGLAALGGLAVVAAAEYAGAGRGSHPDGSPDLSSLGAPSGAVLQALVRLEHPADAAPDDPWRDEPRRHPLADRVLAGGPDGAPPGPAAPDPTPET